MAEESRHELARDRTDWAQQRTLLAKERTFSAWTRTGLSSVAAGLAIARLLASVESPWIARSIGALLILTGGTIFALGFVSYRKALQMLAEEGVRGTPLWIMGAVTSALILATALALTLIFE